MKLTHLAPLGSVVNSDIKGHYLRAKEIVEGNANLIQHVANALLEQREMDGETLSKVIQDFRGDTRDEDRCQLDLKTPLRAQALEMAFAKGHQGYILLRLPTKNFRSASTAVFRNPYQNVPRTVP